MKKWLPPLGAGAVFFWAALLIAAPLITAALSIAIVALVVAWVVFDLLSDIFK